MGAARRHRPTSITRISPTPSRDVPLPDDSFRNANSMSQTNATHRAEAVNWLPLMGRILEKALSEYPHQTDEIREAALYSVGAPGHRWRPILMLTIFDRLSRTKDFPAVMPLACAVEFLHTASIILDDLPAMDDATLRRGKEPCHVKFGQPLAILTACWLCDVAQHSVHVAARRASPDCSVDLEDLFRATKNEMMRGQALDLNGAGLRDD